MTTNIQQDNTGGASEFDNGHVTLIREGVKNIMREGVSHFYGGTNNIDHFYQGQTILMTLTTTTMVAVPVQNKVNEAEIK